jgi:VWFA-related protein
MLAAVALLTSAPALRSQARTTRERGLYVSVVDENGAPVTGLTPADFVIREDAIPREVLKVGPATAPIELTLVVDNSAVTNPLIADMRRALTDFVKEMAPGNQIALATCGGNPEVLQIHTGNAALLEKAIGRLFPISGTGAYLLDALMLVTRGVTKRAPERPVVLAILSQGAPEFSNRNPDTVVTALRNSGVRFDAVTIQSAAGEVPDPRPGTENAIAAQHRDQVLDEGSRATGGVNERALSGLALAPKLKVIGTALRSQYLVTYSRPDSLIPPERIQVSVKRKGLTARGTPVKPGR